MAVIDEEFVASFLGRVVPALRQAVPRVRFRAVPPDDESVDAEVEIFSGEKKLPVSVQVGGGYVGLNRYGYSRPGDAGSFYMQSLGQWGVQPADLLELAKAVNLEVVRLARQPA